MSSSVVVRGGGCGVSDGGSTRSLSEVSEIDSVKVRMDLVAAARRNLGFLRVVAESQWLHQESILVEAIRRYEELWMPLMSDLTVGSIPPMVLPPIDIELVWFCHTLNPVGYKQYCQSNFSKLIGKPAIFDKENEEYALTRCRDIWVRRYPSEPFENESESEDSSSTSNEKLLGQVLELRNLYDKLAEPYMMESVYLNSAKQRYKRFLYIIQRFADESGRLVPASDILLMWLTHQSYPTIYEADVKEMEEAMGNAVAVWEVANEGEVEQTKKLWETAYNQPYEKAGGFVVTGMTAEGKPPVYWQVTDNDINMRYKSMLPRFLLEMCIFVKIDSRAKAMLRNKRREFLRLRMVRCHRELKLDQQTSKFKLDSWQKGWLLYTEFGTKGVIPELRNRGGGPCVHGSKLLGSVTFLWNDLLRATTLSLGKEVEEGVRLVTSITPPVQAPYLLKCVPDRVTDDSGAMISDVILRMNQYRPQEGRWLSRTVLDHAGRECFVIRMRMAGGFWRRGAETPSAVKREERIIEIREGCWSYVAGSIGRVPVKVVGTATLKEPSEDWSASWQFSTGDELMIRFQPPSPSLSSLSFYLKNDSSPDTMVKLLTGRKMQYQRSNEEDGEEDGFVTLVRFTEENPVGKATALLNWKLLVMEFFPEEDAVLMLLICLSILRSVSEMRKEDIGGLLVRTRLKEAKLGDRDWGSVILHPSSYDPRLVSPYFQPWYWNAEAVMASTDTSRQPPSNYPAAEGGDKLFRRGIMP